MRRSRLYSAVSALVLGVALVASSLSGTAKAAPSCYTSWASPVSGDWRDASKWDNGVPTSTQDACITLAGTYTVTSHGDDVGSLTLSGSSATQTLSEVATSSNTYAVRTLAT